MDSCAQNLKRRVGFKRKKDLLQRRFISDDEKSEISWPSQASNKSVLETWTFLGVAIFGTKYTNCEFSLI